MGNSDTKLAEENTDPNKYKVAVGSDRYVSNQQIREKVSTKTLEETAEIRTENLIKKMRKYLSNLRKSFFL